MSSHSADLVSTEALLYIEKCNPLRRSRGRDQDCAGCQGIYTWPCVGLVPPQSTGSLRESLSLPATAADACNTSSDIYSTVLSLILFPGSVSTGQPRTACLTLRTVKNPLPSSVSSAAQRSCGRWATCRCRSFLHPMSVWLSDIGCRVTSANIPLSKAQSTAWNYRAGKHVIFDSCFCSMWGSGQQPGWICTYGPYSAVLIYLPCRRQPPHACWLMMDVFQWECNRAYRGCSSACWTLFQKLRKPCRPGKSHVPISQRLSLVSKQLILITLARYIDKRSLASI